MDMVSFLLDHNANVNQPDSEGWTPLHVAASCGHPEIAECVVHMSLYLADFLPLCGHQSAKCGAKVFLQLNNTNIVFLFGSTTSQLKREQARLVHRNMKLLFLLFSCLFSL